MERKNDVYSQYQIFFAGNKDQNDKWITQDWGQSVMRNFIFLLNFDQQLYDFWANFFNLNFFQCEHFSNWEKSSIRILTFYKRLKENYYILIYIK